MPINLNTEEENPDENFFDTENLEYRIEILITKNTQFPTKNYHLHNLLF